MLPHQDEAQTIGGNGGGGGGVGGGRNTSLLKPPEQIIKCPRCDSPNTKFCYYNNYSLAQPRHYCKACRRYWTKGGALRNVPIGGTCRKSKKTKACSSRFLSPESLVKCSSSDIGRMKVFGLSTLDFQLGGLNSLPPRPVVTPANHLCSSSYGDHVSSDHSLVNLDPLGYNINLPFSSSQIVMKQEHHHHNHHHQQQDNGNGELGSFHVMGTTHTSTDIASSIESLSSINQDLHWKLQQQRLAMLFGGGVNGAGAVENDQQQQNIQVVLEPHHEKLQPILFQNLETSKQPQSSIDGDSRKDTTGGSCGLATEWFFDNSYAPANRNPATSRNGNGGGNDQNGSMNNWNGVQDWNHLNQYSSVP